MNKECFGFVLLGSAMLATIVIICIVEYFKIRQSKEWGLIINAAKNKLSDIGLVINHSYKLINKETGELRFLRIFELKYNPNTKKVYAHCYLVTKDGEIGTWYDEYTYLLDIPTRWDIIDNGEWKPE